MSDSARHQQFDIAVLSVTGAPVVIAVVTYFLYSIVAFRARPGDEATASRSAATPRSSCSGSPGPP